MFRKSKLKLSFGQSNVKVFWFFYTVFLFASPHIDNVFTFPIQTKINWLEKNDEDILIVRLKV